jgi:hypothetical protein
VIRRKYAFSASCVFGIIGFAWFLTQVTGHTGHVSTSFWANSTFWTLTMCAAVRSSTPR